MNLTDHVERIRAIKAREAQARRELTEYRRLFETYPGEYREGFIDGYLRAHADGQEYQCSVPAAEAAFGKYLADGGRALPRQDVAGW